MRSMLLRRVRAAVAALALLAVVGTTIAGTAAAAGAAEAPRKSDEASASFGSVFVALQRLRAAPPVTEPKPAPCVEAGKGEVPELVAAIFRCHLDAAGWSEAAVEHAVAEAVVVSHCESLWDPKAVVFDGRYRDVPHPNGNRYSAAGVFQFIRKTADKWIDGGYARVTDPRRNIDAAARLFLDNRERGFGGWDDWACAAANDGFKRGSVLPGWPGGPAALPDWAHQY